MKIKYDPEADAAYISIVDKINAGEVKKTYECDPKEVGGMVNLDFDADGKLLGVEVIHASKFLRKELLRE